MDRWPDPLGAAAGRRALLRRGTADNKGQHLVNLFALESVIQARNGRLGFNLKLAVETAEERGSNGLDRFIADHAADLAADVFIAGDGPRFAAAVPTLSGGTRGNFQFELNAPARAGAVHSGHWGGLTTDPALLLGHALACICDGHGRILLKDCLPNGGAPLGADVRQALASCAMDDEGDAARVEDGWGEPGLSAAERRYAWNSFTVRAMSSGRPGSPQNAVAPDARAWCEIRYVAGTDLARLVPALRRRLDEGGLQAVRIENPAVIMPASASPAGTAWLDWAVRSVAASTGLAVQVIPNISGRMPGQTFTDHLGIPLVWVPHGHNGCKQHGPDEHLWWKRPGRAVLACRIAAIRPGLDAAAHEERDLAAALTCAGLVECHIHLDKAHILARTAPEEGRDANSVHRTSAVKRSFTTEDIYDRATKVLARAACQGTTRMRTQLELDPLVELRSFEGVRQAIREFAGVIDVEICVVPEEELTNNPGTDELLIAALEAGVRVIGGAPAADIDRDA